MGTFKLHISCTQAMCSLQYRLHMEHFQYTQRGGACGPPLYILRMLVACAVGCTWLMCSPCAVYMCVCVASIYNQIHKSGHAKHRSKKAIVTTLPYIRQ